MDNITEAVLAATRKIIRASDLHSNYIRRSSGLSSAQVLLLKAICNSPQATTGQLAQQISLSHATTTTMLDRLESSGLIQRHRSSDDRRKVHVSLTEHGRHSIALAPMPLQGHFIEQFERLKSHERTGILSALQHVAEMMEVPLASPDQPAAVSRLGGAAKLNANDPR